MTSSAYTSGLGFLFRYDPDGRLTRMKRRRIRTSAAGEGAALKGGMLRGPILDVRETGTLSGSGDGASSGAGIKNPTENEAEHVVSEPG